MHPLAELDHKYVWHPFTQMRDWVAEEPIVIASGKGAVLTDVHERKYLDANSSIWTNLHGHNHPAINAAIKGQLGKIAHSSALGFANEPASLLAERLIKAANAPLRNPTPELTKVFYSDDGSTAMEVALKLSYEYTRRTGISDKPRFLSLDSAYHGDTVGAVSLGHVDLFHKAYGGLLFGSEKVMSPYCYRCPFNKSKAQKAESREYRHCNWECVDQVQQKFEEGFKRNEPITAMVVEPRIQGVAGMIAQPEGWLRRVAEIVRGFGAQLIADEVMTGFGRTGGNSLFASHAEVVQPDFLAVAKGLTGGYLPMAATFTTESVYEAFLGDYTEFKSFFHGHSFTANQLGAAAALASLDLLESPEGQQQRRDLEVAFAAELNRLWSIGVVGDIRRVGLVAGIELVKKRSTRSPIPMEERAGIRVCEAMARRGVLTRPIGSVVVMMPPYCTTVRQLKKMVRALADSIREVLGKPRTSVSPSEV